MGNEINFTFYLKRCFLANDLLINDVFIGKLIKINQLKYEKHIIYGKLMKMCNLFDVFGC